MIDLFLVSQAEVEPILDSSARPSYSLVALDPGNGVPSPIMRATFFFAQSHVPAAK